MIGVLEGAAFDNKPIDKDVVKQLIAAGQALLKRAAALAP
jgi:hypothetical protein